MAVKSTELSKRKKKHKARRVALASLTGAGIALIGVYVGFSIITTIIFHIRPSVTFHVEIKLQTMWNPKILITRPIIC